MGAVLAATDRDVRSAYLDLIRDLIRNGVDEPVPQQWPLRRALLKAGSSVPDSSTLKMMLNNWLP